MVHIVPSVHYANHGFFNYQPRFFLDLAAANEYEIIDLFLGDREERVLELMRPTSTGVYFYPHVPALSGDPNGNLLVSGEKQIGLKEGEEFVRFSGVVNPNNITSSNTVQSTQVADARMEFKANGFIDSAQVMGWLGRFFLSFLPF